MARVIANMVLLWTVLVMGLSLDEIAIFPRPVLGRRQIDWVIQNGGIVHAEVIEVAPGWRKLVIDRDAEPDERIIYIPPKLALHGRQPAVLETPFIKEADGLAVVRHLSGAGTFVDPEALWNLYTYLMWAFLPENLDAPTRVAHGPYLDSLPTYEDLRLQCDWSAVERQQLQMQPWEPGMDAYSRRHDPENYFPYTSASEIGFSLDNDNIWSEWKAGADAVLHAVGYHAASAAERSAMLKRWGVPADFFEDRKRVAWAGLLHSSRAWAANDMWPVLDFSDSSYNLNEALFVDPVNGATMGVYTGHTKGQELFSFPGYRANSELLGTSCHVLDGNEHDQVVLDVRIDRPSQMDNVRALSHKDVKPYIGEPGGIRRVVVFLHSGDVNPLLAVARALAWEGDVGELNARDALPQRQEMRALHVAKDLLTTRVGQFETSLDDDSSLLSEIDNPQSRSRGATNSLGALGELWNTDSQRRKLRTAIVFRMSQKNIIQDNLARIRERIVIWSQKDEL